MKYNVEQTIVVNKNAKDVFEIVSRFEHWAQWSPWNITDPELVNTFDGEGDEYGDVMGWNGPLAGVGEMEVIDYQGESYIAYELRFKKPFRSTAFTSFNLKELADETTELTWAMEGNVPFFLFFMKKQIAAFVNNDFKRGLRMIREYAETGNISSNLEFLGIHAFDATTILSRKNSVAENDMTTEMPKDFNFLVESAKELNISIGRAFTVYTKSDMVNERFDYIAGFEIPTDTQTDLSTYVIPGGDYLMIRHYGSWEHLGNAWVYGFMYLRESKMKMDKKRKPFELYVTSPDANPQRHVVDIYIPVR
jgi:predicted transcriptional regulator YdeE